MCVCEFLPPELSQLDGRDDPNMNKKTNILTANIPKQIFTFSVGYFSIYLQVIWA